MKAFVASEFAYCPLVWMFHSRKLNSQVNKLHERVLGIVYQDYASSFTSKPKTKKKKEARKLKKKRRNHDSDWVCSTHIKGQGPQQRTR